MERDGQKGIGKAKSKARPGRRQVILERVSSDSVSLFIIEANAKMRMFCHDIFSDSA